MRYEVFSNFQQITCSSIISHSKSLQPLSHACLKRCLRTSLPLQLDVFPQEKKIRKGRKAITERRRKKSLESPGLPQGLDRTRPLNRGLDGPRRLINKHVFPTHIPTGVGGDTSLPANQHSSVVDSFPLTNLSDFEEEKDIRTKTKLLQITLSVTKAHWSLSQDDLWPFLACKLVLSAPPMGRVVCSITRTSLVEIDNFYVISVSYAEFLKKRMKTE
ncbi:unnamed protein product [Larinioides sclopetarius]|uniref:Uncharacterized protein n=1 Tax=Larinioides sclopetarius TaxID=280406 RepID=A0AAV2AXK9_9ARAC